MVRTADWHHDHLGGDLRGRDARHNAGYLNIERCLFCRKLMGIPLLNFQFARVGIGNDISKNIMALALTIVGSGGRGFYLNWKRQPSSARGKAFVESYVFAEAAWPFEKVQSSTPFTGMGRSNASVGRIALVSSTRDHRCQLSLFADGVVVGRRLPVKRKRFGSIFLEREENEG